MEPHQANSWCSFLTRSCGSLLRLLYCRMSKPAPSVYEFKGKLAELFPADDPRTPWLLRLAMIGDDLRFELMSAFSLNKDSTADDTWKAAYFIRKITVTLSEAGNIFRSDVPAWIKTLRNPDPRFLEAMKVVLKLVNETRPEIDRIRNGIGGHVRPDKIEKLQPDETEKLFTKEAGRFGAKILAPGGYTFHIDTASFRRSSYRSLTTHSFLFVWLEAMLVEKSESATMPPGAVPDVAKLVEQLDADAVHRRYGERHRDLSKMLVNLAGAILQAIDWSMMAFFREHGVEPTPVSET